MSKFLTTLSILFISQKLLSSEIEPEVQAFYGGTLDAKAMDQLFPFEDTGCINFGFWKDFTDHTISLKERVQSQLNLYKEVASHIALKDGQSILEVGCGRGHGLNLITQLYNVKAYGVDAVAEQIQRCKKNYPAIQERFVCGTASSLNFADNTFDHIYSVEAAQHFPDFDAFVKEAYRVLKPGGTLTISTFFFPHEKAKREIGRILPPGFEGTHYVISIGSAYSSLMKAGFSQVDPFSIGKNTFCGFCAWAKQNQERNTHSQHWVDAYEQGLLDYYILVVKKPELVSTEVESSISQ